MISQDDIAAFIAENGADIKVAREFARRAGKGTPSDRWADGTIGDEAVARGIRAQVQWIEMLEGAFLTIWAEKNGATRLHTQDSKYAQKQEQ